MTETNGNGNGNKKEVPFMGGNIVVKPGGSFKDQSGKEVNYDPVVDVSSIVDSRGRISPSIFLNMINAVTADKTAVESIKALC